MVFNGSFQKRILECHQRDRRNPARMIWKEKDERTFRLRRICCSWKGLARRWFCSRSRSRGTKRFNSFNRLPNSSTFYLALLHLPRLTLETFRKVRAWQYVPATKWNWLLKEIFREEGEEWRIDRTLKKLLGERQAAVTTVSSARPKTCPKTIKRDDSTAIGKKSMIFPKKIRSPSNGRISSSPIRMFNTPNSNARFSQFKGFQRGIVGAEHLSDRERTIVWLCRWSPLPFVAQSNCKDEEFVSGSVTPLSSDCLELSARFVAQIICRTKKKCFSSSEKKALKSPK